MRISAKALSEAGSILGEVGRRSRWNATPPKERSNFARELAAKRWPSYAAELNAIRERQAAQRKQGRGDD
jgi:hypothetical protein